MEPELKKPPLAPKPKLQERPSSLAVPKRIPSQIPRSAAVPTSAPGSKGTKPPIAPKPNLASQEPVVQATPTQHNNLNRSSNGKLLIADPLLVVNVNKLDITDPLGESESSVSCPGAEADRAASGDGHNVLSESQTSKYHENETRMFYGGEQEVTLQEGNGFVQLVTNNMDPSDLGTDAELDLRCFENQTVLVCINTDGADDGDRLNDASWDDCFFQRTFQSKTHAAHPHHHQHSKDENVSFAAGEPDGPGEEADSPGEEADGPGLEADGPRQEADGRGEEADGPVEETDGPGEEADGPGEEADGPGVEADGPGEEADGPGEEADGPGEEADGPGEEADGPGEEADGPGEEADGPGEEADGPGKEADGPGVEADGPGEEADGPGLEADGPGEEADGPGEGADGAGEEADGPGEEAEGPGEEADGPGEEADGPGEEADGPGEEADGPGEEADGPGEEADGPRQTADGPGEEADGPGEEADGPGEEADGPGEEADGPGEEADGPGEEADGPGEEADGPGLEADVRGEEADGPGVEADGPGEEADGRGEEADGPGEEADGPGVEADGPGEGADGPGEGADGPGEEADGPGEEADGPGEEADGSGEGADGPGQEADGPGEEADGPREEADDPGEGADGPGEEADGPGEEADGPREEADGPGLEADDPGEEADGPGLEADDPGEEADGPGEEADGPGVEADGPGEEADGPGLEADDPGEEADGPGEEADGPGVEADGPGEEADGPGEEADDPGEEADGPGLEADGPGEGADGPGEETDGPGEEADGPGEEADGPGEEADGPGQEADGPGEGADRPGQETDSPGEEADGPGLEADGPGEEADGPGEEADGPGLEADGPGEEADGPGEEADDPGEEADDPGEGADGPGEEAKGPGEEVDSFRKEADSPVEESGRLVEEPGGPGVEAYRLAEDGPGEAADYSGEVVDGPGQAEDGPREEADGSGQAADGPGQAADGRGEEADGPGEGADGPGEGADGPGEEADGPGQAADGPGEEADDPGEEADGPRLEADGPGQAADGPGEVADDPGQEADGPGEEADGSGQEADSRGEVADGPGEEAEGPGEEADGPGEEADGPGQEADGPGEEADGPGEEADGPGQEADGPGEEADGPGEEADGPGEEADGPGEEADGPGEEADDPGEEADGRREEADDPGEEADGRGEEADDPGEEADGPGEEADGPGQEADGPGEEADGPGQEADGPGEEADGPGEEADGYGQAADNPVEEADGPWEEADSPWEEADSPGEEADGPREGADCPGQGADKARADVDEIGEDECEVPDAEADKVSDGANEVEANGVKIMPDRFETHGVRADEIMVGRVRVDVFGEDGIRADGVKVDGFGADGLVRNMLTGSSRTLSLKGNFQCNDEDICRTSLNIVSCEQKEEYSPNNEPMELSFDSVTAEQKEFSAREDHSDVCTDDITVEARPTTSKCILPCPIETECSLLLEQNTEHAEKIDVSSASANLRQVNEWFTKVEGDKSVIADWNDMRMRTRSLSTKVPETVPEETVGESPQQTLCGRAIGDPKQVKMDGEVCENMRMIPAKHRRHTFYPRSYSVESRDMPIFVCRKTEVSHLDDSRMKRKEDNFSLPSVVSSGSQLKCNHLPTSTPSSVVDIPPPFQLASITKKPITKSSPSLLVESESPDKYLKQSAKKKSSFKRFLPIKLSLKKKIENKMAVEVNVCRTPSDTCRGLEFDGRSLGNSPQIKARSGKMCILDSSSTFLINKDGKRKGMPKPFSRSVSRVESFENKSRHSYTSLPLTKPRSISFPNSDTSDYENIPAVSSDYENIQIPPRRNGRSGTVTEFFEDSRRVFTSASENDGYVDMTSFAPFESRQNAEQDLESVDSETLTACSPNEDEVVSDEDVGNSSEFEDIDRDLGKQGDIGLEAYHIAKVMTTSERAYLSVLKFLHTDFREAVACVVGGDTCPVMEQEGVTRILCEVSELYELHQEILRELEQSITQWEQTCPRLAHVILAQGPRLSVYGRYIEQFESNLASLDQSWSKSPEFSTMLLELEVYPGSNKMSIKQCLFKLLQRIPQYHLYLTDYLNILSSHSAEYEDTKAGLLVVSEVCDLLRKCVTQGENLQKLLEVEHRVRGLHQVIQPERVLIREGSLFRVTEETLQPRYCFLMSDMFLYTEPQQCGKYQLNKILPLIGMKVSRVSVEETEKLLKIQSVRGSITFCTSSSTERDEWLAAISKAVEDYQRMPTFPGLRGYTEVVCRACSKNKYPLKYLKDKMVRVCDQCHSELKRKELMTVNERSPSLTACSPSSALSSVFHSFQIPFIHKRKRSPTALKEVAASAEGVSISGYLLRCKRNKKHWKKLWFVIYEKVLYTYGARGNKVAAESLPLLGFTVKGSKDDDPAAPSELFQLYHKNILYYSFKAEDIHTAQRWIEAMFEASIL
ncbi:uncharacterized protein LOC119973207 isoform X2 [Scyliorhinus canicula]|uniref:uncharacterized protein LOC119973207 isoform X2 n=1 Tax=Scyliorhinus canicula TaxID=7830 RepID=UPI0018F644C3|nr:uncharacterized protein LOC119973207 isoform X2 [Scyliorhinus canicula]